MQETARAGRASGGQFREEPGGGALLVGFMVSEGGVAGGHAGIKGLRPIFRSSRGETLGGEHGPASPNKIVAKPGYAVAGLLINSGDAVDGFEVIFARVLLSGAGLNIADSYRSKWMGGRGGSAQTLGKDGRLVVGCFGSNGDWMDSLGLLMKGPAPKPPVTIATNLPKTAPMNLAPTAPPVITVAAEPPRPAPASEPVPASTAADLVKAHRNNLVFVSGTDGSGSGFIAKLGAENFLFTNAHVAAEIKGAGFKTLDGAKVAGGVATIAVGHDIFRMQLPAGGAPLEVMQGVDENARIDDEIVVLGNAEGAGVINTIKGKIVGIGPQLVEVDAPFQPGNSGSPIIHLKTAKVIGVATYLSVKKYDVATKEVLKTPVIRRFGYRLDTVKTWQPVNWRAFLAQATDLQTIEKLTRDLDAFLIDLAEDGRVSPGAHANPAIKSRIDQWQASRNRHQSLKDAAAANQNFIAFLKVACRADITAARQRLTYDYFQRVLGEQERDRTAVAEIFDKIIKEIQQAR